MQKLKCPASLPHDHQPPRPPNIPIVVCHKSF